MYQKMQRIVLNTEKVSMKKIKAVKIHVGAYVIQGGTFIEVSTGDRIFFPFVRLSQNRENGITKVLYLSVNC